MKKLMMLAMAALVVGASGANAATGEWMGGVQGGAHIPSGDYGKIAKTGWLGGVFLDYGVTDMVSIGAHADYNATKAKDAAIPPLVNDINFTLLNYGVHGNFFLVPTGAFRPYLMGTLGAYSMKTEIKSDLGNSDDTQTKFGFGGGVGAMMRSPGSPVGFGIEGAVHNVTDAFTDVNGDKKSALYYTITGKLSFSFSDMSQSAGGTSRY